MAAADDFPDCAPPFITKQRSKGSFAPHMRAYIRVDPELADRKCHYPDGALSAFILTMCYAEQQPQRGHFKPNVLKALLERRARWIPYLIEHGDLEHRNGRLYFVGWEEWQEGDWKVGERVERIRARRQTVTPVVTPTVTAPSEAVGGMRYAVGANKDGAVVTPSADALQIVEWWCQKKGWQTLPAFSQDRECRQAESLVSLGAEIPWLLNLLDLLWVEAERKPSTLTYFWQPTQRAVHDLLKAKRSGSHINSPPTKADFSGVKVAV